jgi:hypothetical protein
MCYYLSLSGALEVRCRPCRSILYQFSSGTLAIIGLEFIQILIQKLSPVSVICRRMTRKRISVHPSIDDLLTDRFRPFEDFLLLRGPHIVLLFPDIRGMVSKSLLAESVLVTRSC